MNEHEELSALSDGSILIIEDEIEDQAPEPQLPEHKTASDYFSAICGADSNGVFPHVHIIAEKTPRGFVHHQVRGVREAAEIALRLSAKGHDAYMACAEFEKFALGAKGNRTQANALGARSFWFDVDCGPGKPYVDQAEGLTALMDFCKSAGLSKPSYIVSSGNGLHCYWHFHGFIEKAIWTGHAERLKALAQTKGFHADPTRTADIASVLRIPGTSNWKVPDNPKPVVVLSESGARNLNKFVAALHASAPVSPTPSKPAQRTVSEYPPSSALEISKHCPTLAHVQAARGAVSEPLWRAMIGVVKYSTEGNLLCHQWSTGDPRYGVSETQEKIDKWTKGPTLCSTFRSLTDAHCSGCTQMCKSPIQLGTASRSATAKFNDSHFVSKVGNTVLVFDEREPNILMSGMTFDNFKNFHADKVVDGKNVAGLWLRSPGRRTYDKLVFDPSGRNASSVYNAWRGLTIDPKRGWVKRVLRHILEIWCNRDGEQFKYVLRWMALLVQQPWLKPEVALVLRSKEGTGKNIIVQMLLDMFGPHGFITAQKDQVAGRFNGHLFDKVLVALDEAFFAGDPAAVAAAKALITNSQIGYEAKGKDAFSARNYAHVIVLTNNAWAVPAGEDARRWAVLDVSEARAGDHAYFRALAREIENGGTEAFLGFLMRINLRGFNPRAVPKSDALQAQRVETLLHSDPVAAWWLTVLAEGEFPIENGSVDYDAEISAGEMQQSYKFFTAGARHAPAFPTAAKRLRRLLPGGVLAKVRKAQAGDRIVSYQLPDLADARQHFQNVTGIDPCAS